MIVWFHSTREQEPDDNGKYDYDTYTDSRLFANLTVCTQDAERARLEDLDYYYKRYKDSMERRALKLEAIHVLKTFSDINPEDLYWNVSSEPPEMGEPQERYIYPLEVQE